MPALKKRALSLYLRNRCQRQMVLYMYTDPEREKHNMPSRQQRAGLGLIGLAGYRWQDDKVRELKEVFGAQHVIENPESTENRPKPIPLIDVLSEAQSYQFIVEGDYKANTNIFREAIGMVELRDFYGDPVGISDMRPDVIQVFPPMNTGISPRVESDIDPYTLMVLPNGFMEKLPSNDSRLRLRVIDIKLTSEPGANYFAEVVYYSMSLSAWLIENTLDDRFVVVAAPAIWPGQHQSSNLIIEKAKWQKDAYTPTGQDLMNALEGDLELALFDVFAPRIRSLLTEELPRLLSTHWSNLDWHVDQRCKGCEFVGYQWGDEDEDDKQKNLRCMPTAESLSHLSRVVGISPGSRSFLVNQSISTVNQLAEIDTNSSVFNEHQGLRAKRTIFPFRARSIGSGKTAVIPNSGGDVLMPKWADLRIYIFLDYDLSSAITTCLGIRANWREPVPYGMSYAPEKEKWQRDSNDKNTFIVDRCDIEVERSEFIRFLRFVNSIVEFVRNRDEEHISEGRRKKRSTYQIYLWDRAQYKHLVRLISRHLPHIIADNELRELAWLFPPTELLPEQSEATRRSTITFLKTAVMNTVALDMPHYYRLLDLAQAITPEGFPVPFIHGLYHEVFSDLIPMERLHEYWNKKDWVRTQGNIIQATNAKVYGMSLIQEWLRRNLGELLVYSAPVIGKKTDPIRGVAQVSRLWIRFTELNASLTELEKHTTRMMPLHERETRLKSARFIRRLEGSDKVDALNQIEESLGIVIADTPDIFIYKMHEDSQNINIKPGEFLFALSPATDSGFLDLKAITLTEGTKFESSWHYQVTVEATRLTTGTVEAIDRLNLLIVLKMSSPDFIHHLESTGKYDFSKDVAYDPIHADFLTKKLKLTLRGIKNPPSASDDDHVSKVMKIKNKPRNTKNETPASEIIWNPKQIAKQITGIDTRRLRIQLSAIIDKYDKKLNESQWVAWDRALNQKLSLIWGPPGTGKSQTLRAILQGLVLDASQHQKPIRILVSANTYTAIDNVLLDLESGLRLLALGENSYKLHRVQSKFQEEPPKDWETKYPSLENLVLNTYQPSSSVRSLISSLESPKSIVVMGCPPQQLHNLAVAGKKKDEPKHTICDWFDYILIDEASQIDVATSTLIFSKRASDGAVVLAGDDLQLPPIHQAQPPENLEFLVGSLYNYYRWHHDIEPSSLNVNYRSNKTIVEFTKLAGYSEHLTSHFPNQKLEYFKKLPITKPKDWPYSIYWTQEWASILSANFPTVSIVYTDELSNQVNLFEADAIVALVYLLKECLQTNDFWGKGIGIVTPHRAQMAKVVSRLKDIFPDDPYEQIYDAVDTVERYQGQQRDIIIASFGVGDPDLIQSEDEFLYSLNRFNVLSSRARSKVIVFCTKSLLEHLSNDIDVLSQSRLLKLYVETYCQSPRDIQLGYYKNGVLSKVECTVRQRRYESG